MAPKGEGRDSCPNCGGSLNNPKTHVIRSGSGLQCFSLKGKRLFAKPPGPFLTYAETRYYHRVKDYNWVVDHIRTANGQDEALVKRKLFIDKERADQWRSWYIRKHDRGPYWGMFNAVKQPYPFPTSKADAAGGAGA